MRVQKGHQVPPYDHEDMSKNLHLSAAAYNALSATSMKLLFIDNRKDMSARWLRCGRM